MLLENVQLWPMNAEQLKAYLRQFDETRVVSAAMNGGYSHTDDPTVRFRNALDEIGMNYHTYVCTRACSTNSICGRMYGFINSLCALMYGRVHC